MEIATIAIIVLIVAAVALGIGLYFIPTWIALARRHPHLWLIIILNFLAGWTTIGWVAALIWALLPRRIIEG